MLLEKVQTQLESIYGFGLKERVEDYLINKQEAVNLLRSSEENKLPKELFLVRQPQGDVIEIALFLDPRLIANLGKHDPFKVLNQKNLSDFCILIEGISHFVYYLWKAHHEVAITQLEMELQAEIDKFLMLFFYLRSGNNGDLSYQIFKTLFEDFKLVSDLAEESQERYLTATSLACRYCYLLQKKLSSNRQVQDIVDEVRLFYSLSQAQKIKHIIQ